MAAAKKGRYALGIGEGNYRRRDDRSGMFLGVCVRERVRGGQGRVSYREGDGGLSSRASVLVLTIHFHFSRAKVNVPEKKWRITLTAHLKSLSGNKSHFPVTTCCCKSPCAERGLAKIEEEWKNKWGYTKRMNTTNRARSASIRQRQGAKGWTALARAWTALPDLCGIIDNCSGSSLTSGGYSSL